MANGLFSSSAALIASPLYHFMKSAREIGAILSRTLLACIKGPRRGPEILGYLHSIGVESLPIIAISTAFAGFVVTAELAYQMDNALHTVEMLPGFSGQFVLRELGIVIPALLMVSKVGAATTAEVGSMTITEQIDALRLLQIDPIEYLVYPRFVASTLAGMCLTLFAVFVTLGCGMLLSEFKYNIGFGEYLNALSKFVTSRDLIGAVVKGCVFGGVVPIISCFYGFRCAGGAEGVGNATTNAVVTSTLIIIVLDFLLTFAFSLVLY